MEKRDILETLINCYCEGVQARFAGMIGIKPATLSNWIKRNTFDYDVVYAGCPDLSGDYLLSGEGEIFQSKRIDNSGVNEKILSLCKHLVENYQQRDEVMKQMASMVENLKDEG